MASSYLTKISLALALSSTPLLMAQSKSGRPDVYTTSVFKIKSDVSFEAAKKTLEELNVVLHMTKGFEKRNLFYDKEQNLWIDQIKWKHVDVARSGVKTLANDPKYSAIQKITDGKPTASYQAERVLEVDAK